MPSKRLSDSAALAALDPGLGGGGGAPMGMPMPGMEEMAGMEAAPAEGGMDAALSMIEAELAAAPPDLAEEARTHIEALRDIGTRIGGAEMPAEAPPMEEPPVPTGGEEV